MQRWQYITTHILNFDTPCRCGIASCGGRFNVRTTRRPCCQSTEDCEPHTRSWRCAAKDFSPCRKYNCDFSVKKTEDKLSTFAYFPCRIDLLQNLLFPHPVKIIPALHGTTRFITVFKTANQLCLYSDKLITVKNSDIISGRSILILFFHLRLGLSGGLLHSGFPNKTHYAFLFSSYVPPTFPPLLPSFHKNKQHLIRS